MNNKSNLIAYGLMSLALVLGIFLSVQSVNKTQDTRSSAADEETVVIDEVIDGICGTANGQTVEFAPADEEAPAEEEAIVSLLSGLVVPMPNSLLVSFQNRSEKGVQEPPSL